MKFKALLPTLIIIFSALLPGCILDYEFKGTHVGTFDIDQLGKGSTNLNDEIVALELLNSTINQILYNDGTGTQDGGEHFRFRIVVGDLDDPNNPVYECGISSNNPGDCLINETVDDGIWEIGEIITLEENGANICDSGCQVQLTIMNGDITTELEENLQFVADHSVAGGPITHLNNFWMGNE
jgi:hypothetical protein